MDEIFKLLNPDNTVTINRPLAHALGTNEAIIYAALIANKRTTDSVKCSIKAAISTPQ